MTEEVVVTHPHHPLRGEAFPFLGKSCSAPGRHSRELEERGVCQLESAPNQHRGSVIRVRATHWQYEKAAEAGREGAEASDYVAGVRRMFPEPTCVLGPSARPTSGWGIR